MSHEDKLRAYAQRARETAERARRNNDPRRESAARRTGVRADRAAGKPGKS